MAALHELFQWAIENTPQNENGQKEPPKELKPLDKKFLEAVLKSDADKMKSLVKTYLDPNASLEEKEIALEDLEFYVQSIDNACDLHHPTVNGLVNVLQGISYNDNPNNNNHKNLRFRCAWVLATALQNNPKVQQKFLELNGMNKLIEILQEEVNILQTQDEDASRRGDLELLAKLVYAISSALANKQLIKEFRQHKGFQALTFLLRLDPSTLRVKINKEREEEEKKELEETAAEDEEFLRKVEEDSKTKKEVDEKEVKDIEDEVKERAIELKKNRATLRQKKRQNFVNQENDEEDNEPEDPYSMWLRLARRIVFLLFKLMAENEELKLAFAIDDNAETVKTLLHLLETQQNDVDLTEKTLKALATLVSSNATSKLHNVVMDSLKREDLLTKIKSLASKVKSDLSANNEKDSDSFQLADEITKKL